MTATPFATPFDARRQKALALLAAAGIRKSNYQPLALTLMWRVGLQVPPPHFASFWGLWAVAGLYFSVVWGLIMWIFVWQPQGLPMLAAAFNATLAGALFGLAMAGYYAFGRKRHQLPAWQSL